MDDYSFQGRKHIKRDYYNKTFSNPYFKTTVKNGSKFNTKLYIQALTAVFLVYLIIYSDLFKVHAIEVQGTDMINPQEIEAIADGEIKHLKMFIFPGRNLLFVSANDIEKLISAKYSLNSLKIKKGWQKINIIIEEKPAHIIAENRDSFHFIDALGTVTKELTADDLNKYKGKFPSLSFAKALNINDKPISDRAVNYVLELNEAFKASNIKVRGFESGEVDEIFVVTEAGWKAKFNINLSLSRSMENMLLVYNKKLIGKKFDYIDLRFGDRVTYFPEK